MMEIRAKELLDYRVSYVISESQRKSMDRMIKKFGLRGDSDLLRQILDSFLKENDKQYSNKQHSK